MKRSLGRAVVVGTAVLIGCVLGSHSMTRATPQDLAPEQQVETLNQLREINDQLKGLSALLCSGKVRVVVVLNPDQE